MKGFNLTKKKTCKLSKELQFAHIVIHALDSHHHWSCQLRLVWHEKKVPEQERPHRNSWRGVGRGHIALSCPLSLPSHSNGFQSSVQCCIPQYHSIYNDLGLFPSFLDSYKNQTTIELWRRANFGYHNFHNSILHRNLAFWRKCIDDGNPKTTCEMLSSLMQGTNMYLI